MSATNLPFGQIINFDYAFFITPQEREAVEVIPLHHHMMSYSPYKKVSWKWHETTYFLDIIHISSRTNSQDEFAIDYFVLVSISKIHTSFMITYHLERSTAYHLTSRLSVHSLRSNLQERVHFSYLRYETFHFRPYSYWSSGFSAPRLPSILCWNYLGHQGNLNLKATIQVHVKWLRFDDSHHSWKPYSNLRDIVILHDSLSQQKLTKLIPKTFRYTSSS